MWFRGESGSAGAIGFAPSVFTRSRLERRVWLSIAAAGVAAVGATATMLNVSAGAVLATFVVAAALATAAPRLVAPFLALLLPVGFWSPEIVGVQAPPLELAVVGAATGCLFGIARDRRVSVRSADVALAVVVGGVFASALSSVDVGKWAHDVTLWSGLLVVFCATASELRKRSVRRLLLLAIAVSALVEAILALVQYARGSHTSEAGGAFAYGYSRGTLQHPNALGPFLVFCLLLLAGAAAAERGYRRLGMSVAVAVVAVATVTPFSRGAWIALAVGSVAWTGMRYCWRVAAFVTFGLIAAGAAFSLFAGGAVAERLSSLGAADFSGLYGFRVQLAGDALRLIARHPITGAGAFNETGTYVGKATLATHPHDEILGVAVFYGVPAAVGFCVLFVLALRAALRARQRRSSVVRAEAAGAAAALVALAIDGLFEYSFWNLALTVLIVLLFAYAVALEDVSEGARVPPRLSANDVRNACGSTDESAGGADAGGVFMSSAPRSGRWHPVSWC